MSNMPTLTFDEEAAVKRVRDCGALDVPENGALHQMYFRLAGWGYVTIAEGNPGFWRVALPVVDPTELKYASEAEIAARLVDAGADAVWCDLRDEGYAPVSIHYLKRIRKQMVQEGTANRLTGGSSNKRYVPPNFEQAGQRGSAALEEAVIALYQRVANDRGCSVEVASLLMNYSREQIVRMAA